MRHADFVIGREFRCGGRDWRCTDVGTRTVIAVALGMPADWYTGPPYIVAETVFDENDLPGCELVQGK